MKKSMELNFEVSCADCVHRGLCSDSCCVCDDFAMSTSCVDQFNAAVAICVKADNVTDLLKDRADGKAEDGEVKREKIEINSLDDFAGFLKRLFDGEFNDASSIKVVKKEELKKYPADIKAMPTDKATDKKPEKSNDKNTDKNAAVKPATFNYPKAFCIAYNGFDVCRTAWPKSNFLRADKKNCTAYVVDKEGRRIRDLVPEDLFATDWYQLQ